MRQVATSKAGGFTVSVPLPESSGEETITTVIVSSPCGRRKSQGKRGTPRGSRDGGDAAADPYNFLLGGGGRRMDGERAQARAAAASRAAADLRGSNAALTAELARVRAEGEREGGALRTELASLAGRFKAEQERLVALRERLAAECLGRAELEAAHQERVQELHKRLQAEHLLRVNAELDAGRAQDKAGSGAVTVKGLEQQLEAARREAAELREARLEGETAHNKERLAQAGLLAELESLKTAVAREKHSREAQQKKCAELEASLRSLASRSNALEDELRGTQAAADAAATGRVAAEAAATRAVQDQRAAAEQLEVARQGRMEAAAEAAEMQERVAELEASTALYIAKTAHYDDLKEEHDEACRQLEQCRSELERARSEARSSAQQLGELSRQAARVPQLSAELEQTQEDLKEVQGLLGDTQAAFKLLMETVREKEAAAEALEGQTDELRAAVEGLRRHRDEAASVVQEREAELGCARRDLQAAQEEAGSWQRRCKSLQGEADGRELELARRDLQAKELADALHLLNAKAADEAAAAASDRKRLEGVVKSLEGRVAQAQLELARTREELVGAEHGAVTARAELETVQEDCKRLRAQLNEEQLRASKLRGELAVLSGSHLKEQQEKSGLLADTLTRLQTEEAGRMAAQQEAKALKRRVDELEASLAEAASARVCADEAHAGSQAALESMRRKLEVYKRENKNLLGSYDTWLKQTMAGRQPVVGASP